MLFFRIWYTDGWEIGLNIGIESQIFKVRQAHPRTILVNVYPRGFVKQINNLREFSSLRKSTKGSPQLFALEIFHKSSCLLEFRGVWYLDTFAFSSRTPRG